MLRATGSTGRKKGAASFIFFKVRTVDWQNRHWLTLSVDESGELLAEVMDCSTGMESSDWSPVDGGGGVALSPVAGTGVVTVDVVVD